MSPRCLRGSAAAAMVASWMTGTALSGCTALLRLPTGQLDVSDEGISIDLPGGVVNVSHQRLTLDLFDIEVEFNNG